MNFLDCMKQNLDLIDHINSIILLLLGIYGLTLWRKQLKGTTQYAIAREILESLYRVKSAFSHVRYIQFSTTEYPEHLQNIRNLNILQVNEALTYAYNERMKKLNIEFKNLQDNFIKGLVIFGDKYKNSIIPIQKCRYTLILGIDSFLRSERDKNYFRKKYLDFDKIIYESNVKECDILSTCIEDAFETLLIFIKPYLVTNLKFLFKRINLNKRIEKFTIPLPYINPEIEK